MKINIVGAGYVGLVTGLVLANVGHEVKVFDNDKEKVELIKRKVLPFYEKGLKKLLIKSIKNNLFTIYDFKMEYFGNPEIILVCVGTPTINGKISLVNLSNVAIVIGEWLRSYKKFCSLIIKSTVTPGTTDTFFKKLIEDTSFLSHENGDFGLGMNPEFLREGDAVNDSKIPDRIVIGFEDLKTKNKLTKLYSSFSCKKIYTNSRTAEMSKYVNNALLAIQISAINELANISNNLENTSFSKILDVVKNDHRWSVNKKNNSEFPSILNYLVPGPGFGGSCFPKDLKALSFQAMSLDVNPLVLNAVINTNENQPEICIDTLLKKLSELTHTKKILFLGLTFKPETDDLRESTSIKMINHALNKGCMVKYHDPFFTKSTLDILNKNSKSEFVKNWTLFLDWSDAIVVATTHKEYRLLLDMNIEQKTIIFDPRRFFLNKRISFQKNYLSIG